MTRGTCGALLLAGLLSAGCPSSGTNPGGGTPVAQLSASSVDFGALGCGQGPSDKQLTLTNSGNGPLTFTAVSSGNGFSATPMSGTVEAGKSTALTISATVSAAASAGAAQSGTLSLSTNDSAHAKLDVALSASARGVTLSLTPTVASFGVLPVGTQAPALPLTLTNTGNVAATVSLADPSDDQFSVNWDGAPATATIAPGASMGGLSAGFRPSSITPSTSSAAITVAEPVCGASVATLPLNGQGTNGVLGLSSTNVFFGTQGIVPCGTQASSQTLTLTNSGNQAFSWTATLAKGASSPFTFSPQSGTVPANSGSVTLTFDTTAIPSEAPTQADAFGDTLTLVTDVANDSPHLVALHQTAGGAVLSFAPGSLDFGLVPINNSSTAPFTLVNDGSLPANVTLSSSSGKFSLLPAGPVAAPAAGGLHVDATFSPGTSVLTETADVTVAVDSADVLCAPLPGALTLAGTGTNGSVSFSPAAVDFGQVDCGATAAPQTVTFHNDGNQDYAVQAALAVGTNFSVSMSPDSGVVAQDGGTVVLTITPAAIPQTSEVTPNLYGDTLTVTTDVTGDSPHDIPLRETAHGSIFALSTTSLDFGSVAVGSTGSSQYTVTNNGNAAGTLSFASGQPSIFTLPQNATINAHTSAAQVGGFSPASVATYSDTATLSTSQSTVLCRPLPFTSVSLAGVGTGANVVSITAQALTFGSGGLVNCGTQATAQSVQLTNGSSQTLDLTYTLALGSNSPYTVAGPPTVAAGATVTVTVTPLAVPSTASTAADGLADTLTITASGGPVSEGHTIALHETAQGAVLTFNPTSLAFTVNLGGKQTQSFTLNNSGNVAAPFALTVGGTNASNYSVSPTGGTVGAGGSASEAATFSSALLGGTGSRSGSVSVSSSAPLCAPLPAALTLGGTIN